MKKTLFFLSIAFLAAYCGRPETSSEEAEIANTEAADPSSYDPNRGLGRYENFEVGATLDPLLATEGEKIAGTKCKSCHKMTEERLVGPGWKGVTTRRTPTWLMNFITDPDPMISVDPELQTQLELCLVRMPNQNVSEDEGKAILEFMRQNDGVK
jgi:cytochrome c5